MQWQRWISQFFKICNRCFLEVYPYAPNDAAKSKISAFLTKVNEWTEVDKDTKVDKLYGKHVTSKIDCPRGQVLTSPLDSDIAPEPSPPVGQKKPAGRPPRRNQPEPSPPVEQKKPVGRPPKEKSETN
jgi:hypothetical protein